MRRFLVLLALVAMATCDPIFPRSSEESVESAESAESHEAQLQGGVLPQVPQVVTCQYAATQLFQLIATMPRINRFSGIAHVITGYDVTNPQEVQQLVCEIWDARTLTELIQVLRDTGVIHSVLRFQYDSLVSFASMYSIVSLPPGTDGTAPGARLTLAINHLITTMDNLGLLDLDPVGVMRIRQLMPQYFGGHGAPQGSPGPVAPPSGTRVCEGRLLQALQELISALVLVDPHITESFEQATLISGIDPTNLQPHANLLCQLEVARTLEEFLNPMSYSAPFQHSLRFGYNYLAQAAQRVQADFLRAILTGRHPQRSIPAWRAVDAFIRSGLLSLEP